MKDIIKRNREALEMATNNTMIESFAIVNNMLPIDTMIHFNKQGYEYILADGVIIGVE